ncbi:MAG: phosphopyruvate hydratase [Candidatus Altiarchaeota archaeon]|nr:phosphopyruvate hydratase [Candidatus Altiarchaeota archaeon]
MDSVILAVKAREVLDSRGNPTVEAEVRTRNGISRAIVPSGASTGIHEALELRDKGKDFLGKGVSRAVANVNDTIARMITGMDCLKQREMDEALIESDGTENKSNLGANAILPVSMAVSRAAALEQDIPLYEHMGKLAANKDYLLPIPSMNVINGGVHAGNKLDIQEYMILPTGAASFREAVRISAEVYQTLKGVIKERYGKDAINVGDEGGFAPPLSRPEEPLDLIWQAVEKSGHAGAVKLGIDAAASELYTDGCYVLEGKKLSPEELAERYARLIADYPLASMEDVYAQDDWDSWQNFTEDFGSKVQIVGDDLLVTNPKRIEKAVSAGACNALLLKINQIGTISESIDAAKISLDSGWNVMVSHRSGETEDPYIADLAVGLGSGEIKSGAPCRSERTVKYNQLLRIEEELGEKARYSRML